jgi:glycosyltransferase involved in cell wall biosynthesis
MRVLHVVHSDAFSGVERHVAVLAGAQATAGHDVIVIGGDPAAMADAAKNPDVRRSPGGTVAEVVTSLGRYARGADLLHTHMTVSELAGVLSLGRGGAPVVSTRHFADRRGSGRLGLLAPVVRPLLARRLAAQIAVSRYVAEHIDGPSQVVHAGVLEQDAPEPASRDRVVLLAQRLEPEKRGEVALMAFAVSGLAATGWRLDIAGTGSQRGDLERLAVTLGLTTSQVRFLGQRSDIPELMAQAGLLIAPRPDEAYGLSVLEAMACGLPVVATGAAGHLETLGLLDAPALFPPDDVAAAADLLRALADNPDERARLADAQRDLQRSRFTLTAQQRATDDVYRGVL